MSRLLRLAQAGAAALGLLAMACGAPIEQAELLERAPLQPLVGSAAPKGLAGAPLPAAPRGAFQADTAALPTAEQRLIIRNGQISLVVADLDASLQAVVTLAQELGGFMVSSSRAGEKESAFAQVTIRVPADKFELALERFRRLGHRVESESTSSQDVTEEFIDLQARLRNLEATERQLVALLDRAGTVEDVLKVHRELTSVRSEIERLQGRIQYLERSAAYSLITVSLRPATSPEPLVNPRWSSLETARQAVRNLVGGLQGIAAFGIWAVVFAPLWLPSALLLAWAAWRWRRRRARRATPAATGTV